MWNIILFDLDGTLTDSQAGIINSVKNALDYFGIQEERENMTCLVGPPLHDTFREIYGFNAEQISVGTAKFREYFNEKGWLENAPYPGIAELLQTLKAAGKQLVVATSKPEGFAVRILEHFGLAQYFDHICGAPMDEQSGAKKAQVISNALSYYEHAGWNTDAVMVGDRKYDVIGAHEKGLAAIGVLYGYGDREELEEAGADFVAGDLEELRELLLFDAEIGRRWFQAFAPAVKPEQVCRYIRSKCLSSCMWAELSSSHCLEGAEARRVFDAQEYARAIVFKEGFDCAGKTCKVTAAELDQEDGDLYVVDENFRWTYVHTHEDGWCGPYFCWNTANGISGS